MYSDQQRSYLAHWLTLSGKAEDSLTQTIASARVDMNPHQVEAAMFALASPLSNGVILADEVGLGKTIEASLILAQKWAERRRKLLLIAPATLRKQWSQELEEKFSLPSRIIEAKSFNQMIKEGCCNPFDIENSTGEAAICICSYEFASRKEHELARIPWDLVVMDEAHKLRNIYKSDGAKTAKKLSNALSGRKKILLSATPLQNSILELYGLVSVIDPHFFGDLASFKARYSRQNIDDAELALLRVRLNKICNRTLRRQVQQEGGISFTRRHSITEDFRPTEDEEVLYKQVSSYLQQDDLLAIKSGARHLVTLVIRKILASSSTAIQGTLETMIHRLENKMPVLDALTDYENYDDYSDEEGIEDEDTIDPRALQAEIDQLKSYKTLAESITKNAKAEALLSVLSRAFEFTVELGGLRKAVIFTESVRTQTWLAQLLSDNGYEGEVVLLNGSNSDAASRKIYSDWLEKHQNSGRVSGSRTADMKAALVEKFRDEGTLMICTEAGAEGINLQFCSLLINYDLPWNPQRVEQRIGRVHRYGQKHDVVVVNFINKGNRADQRVFELLSQKFQLFEGVFGASDDILGSIESGVDIERRIHEIYQHCRSDEQIEQEFNQLQDELKDQLENRENETRRSLFEHFDVDVVRNLKTRRTTTLAQLNVYQENLLLLAEMFLSDNSDFQHSETGFRSSGKYYDVSWPVADEKDAEFFRPNQGYGKQLIDEALHEGKDLSTLPVCQKLHFIYQPKAGQLADVKLLCQQSGQLLLAKVSIGNQEQQREQLLVAAVTENGEVVAEETASRLLRLPLSEVTSIEEQPVLPTLTAQCEVLRNSFIQQVERDNELYYNEEVEKLERWSEDRRIALDLRIKQLDAEIKEARKTARQLPSLKEKMEAKRSLKALERERDNIMLQYHDEKKKIEQEEDRLLEEVEQKLATEITSSQLFAVSWTLNSPSA
ncbi:MULTISPECIES: SNF2-related protein [Enterobacteriaceae]|uniref:SNF2-related protein n=1 Tax=Enterobacteriaceae TaxID=543 RepID=UPI000796735B|nr:MULTISPECIES: SNF2-related protein [Enterobacteriaceae]MBJ3557981.1 DEAD/DEAH box helicase family protein [Salmonella enterica subsp. enterica serovar Derby]HCP8032671.1 DEAD/DEAH box helicase family protein [Escherichia coli]EJN7214941.1 DEAD/DEAH box helicase family protein [Citrobacter freundii]EKY2869549.1 DEAD/DEAH box helicase family protein [Citrobacter freundii]ELD6607762.1 DEAD/DEAH box helicase family protein [Citrobacter freundii]